MNRSQNRPWVPANLLKDTSRIKADYIPSHEREGFDESLVEVVPTNNRVSTKAISAFVINRNKPLP